MFYFSDSDYILMYIQPTPPFSSLSHSYPPLPVPVIFHSVTCWDMTQSHAVEDLLFSIAISSLTALTAALTATLITMLTKS